jgi:S1-C subfamily serine protease
VQEKQHPLLDDPVFSQFFGDQLQRRQRSRSETNLGSGVMIGSEGYILTNQHVIDGADEILIALADGRGSQAVLIGEDRETDIAILQIPMSGLAGITIADSRTLRVGDVVLAIGNPLNVGQTVTMGIISATGRDRIGLNTFENFIQTDAAINPGNSGGALVQIIEHGEVSRGWLGVEGTELSARAARATGIPGIRGALIVGVFINSPADMAGIRAGDIVVGVNGNPVLGIRDLLDQITLHKPGEEIEVTIYRGTQKLNVDMKVTQRP